MNLNTIIIELIRHNLRNRAEDIGQAHPSAYAREHCTVTLGTCRKAGHTFAINRICDEFHDVLVIRSCFGAFRDPRPLVVSWHNFNTDMLRGKKLDVIVVDDASFMKGLDILYSPTVLECFQGKPLYVFLH
jgi:hypothetical protein